MTTTTGRIVYETIRNHGVDCLFGMEDPIHVFHAVDRATTRIVTVRDEKHGAIMAHAYSQVTGRPGVCAATFGPGATNLITGLLEAQRSSVPVIALVQDHPLNMKGRHASSELDTRAAMAPFVKAVIRIDAAEEAGDKTRAAFRLATGGRPGPVALICPTDVMAAESTAGSAADPLYISVPANRTRADRASIAATADLLIAAERPLLVAGGGSIISGAFAEIAALAELFTVPVATTMTGKGAIADSHPLALGVLGTSTGGKLGRGRIANTFLAEADVVFIMGSRTGQICYSDWTLPKPGTKVIHLDVDPAEIGRNFATDVAMVGDVRDSLRDLLQHCGDHELGRPARDNGGRIIEMKQAWEREMAPVANSGQRPIRPERVFAEIDRVLDARSLLVADASYVTGWSMSQLMVPTSGRFILSPRGTGGIGWSLPAAIGAKIGAPDRDVICVSGDGAFGYQLGELETAARYNIDILVIVFNNSTLAFQRHWEELAMNRYLDCDFLDVDYSAVARALKCGGESVDDPADLAAAIGRGRAYAGPYIINAVIDPEAAAPIIGFDKPIPSGASH
ncbi:MAG: acetolactate synthase catalytic subunit [Alphaproteobacteria bacterium]|nr:acetolactate synthase catalytic subunit [Alphaproteobacteria bacterium]